MTPFHLPPTTASEASTGQPKSQSLRLCLIGIFWSLSHKIRRSALPPETDGCEARCAGNGCSIAKRRNVADAVSGGNPSGRGDFAACLCRAPLVWNNQTARCASRPASKSPPSRLSDFMRQALRYTKCNYGTEMCILTNSEPILYLCSRFV